MTALYALKNLKPVILNMQKATALLPLTLKEEPNKRIAKSFGEDLKKGVKTLSVKRNGQSVNITFMDERGQQINVLSKYAFVSFPPLLKNLKAFDLSESEKAFGKFNYSRYWY